MLAARAWAFVILGCVIVGAIGASYVKGRSDGRALEFAERATLDEVARVAREAAIEAAGEKIASIEVKNVVIRQKLETEIREKPVFRDCVADQRVFDITNEAITGNPAPGSGELPATGANDGKILW